MTRQITVDDLAKRLGMSTRNFDRRFRAAVGEAPTAYLQKLRIEKAKRLLETTGNSVAEIMLKVGYADERSFRRLFQFFDGALSQSLSQEICYADFFVSRPEHFAGAIYYPTPGLTALSEQARMFVFACIYGPIQGRP